MKDIWFISDTHFNHANILKFKNDAGDLIRPSFTDVFDMDAFMIHQWNSVVKPQDKVYHLGDVYFGSQKRALDILRSLNGHKRLCLGNHDDAATRPINLCFEKITFWCIFKEFDFFCCHVPLPKEAFGFAKAQVHGHIHHNVHPDPAFINVCVEQTYYTPVHLDDIIKTIKDRGL